MCIRDRVVVLQFAAEPLLMLFGASDNTLPYALSYLNIYGKGTLDVYKRQAQCPEHLIFCQLLHNLRKISVQSTTLHIAVYGCLLYTS